MPKDLLKFLFSESFLENQEDAMGSIFEQMANVEDLEVKSKPLEKALADVGIKAKVDVDLNGAFARFDSGCEYREARSTLSQAEVVVKLAELGWVPTFGNDTNTENDVECFLIYFIDIDQVEPSDSNDLTDLENLVKDTADFQNQNQADGIGADLKIPKADVKGNKVPDAPKVSAPIRDSLKEDSHDGVQSRSFEEIMQDYQRLDPKLKSSIRKIAVDSLRDQGSEEIGTSDVNHQIVSLFKIYGNWEEIDTDLSEIDLESDDDYMSDGELGENRV